MLINCESLRINFKSCSPLLGEDQQMTNQFLFLKSSPVYVYLYMNIIACRRLPKAIIVSERRLH